MATSLVLPPRKRASPAHQCDDSRPLPSYRHCRDGCCGEVNLKTYSQNCRLRAHCAFAPVVLVLSTFCKSSSFVRDASFTSARWA